LRENDANDGRWQVVVESGPPRAIFRTPERDRTKRFIASLNTAVSYDI
jgi:cystine transport system ATP-binding protein